MGDILVEQDDVQYYYNTVLYALTVNVPGL